MFSFFQRKPDPRPSYQEQAEQTLLGVIRTLALSLDHAANVCDDAADYLKDTHKDAKGAVAIHKKAAEFKANAAEWLG